MQLKSFWDQAPKHVSSITTNICITSYKIQHLIYKIDHDFINHRKMQKQCIFYMKTM